LRALYLRKESGQLVRKVMIDMAYLVSHRQIRLPKIYYEEGLYLPFIKENQIDKYDLTKDKIIKEDEFHYYFDFPFSAGQVENSAA
jgi:hypothetical protein